MAQVETVDRETGQVFARITVKPMAGADRSSFLLVLGENAAMMARPEEPVGANAEKKTGRGKGRRNNN